LASGSTQSVTTAGWLTKPQFARDIKKTERTVDRYIARGMPVIYIGATTYIDPNKARDWFEDGMPPPQPVLRSRARRRAADAYKNAASM
jgi:hypothetical protein